MRVQKLKPKTEIPKLKRDWEGRYVRLRHDIERKDGLIFPAGEIMRVEGNHGGLLLRRLYACPHCGAKENQYIRRIYEYKVELLPLAYRPQPQIKRPPVVVLCGSTRFWKTFQEVSLKLAEERKIVLSIGSASGTDEDHYGHLTQQEHDDKIAVLNELHLRKIDMADEVMILNVGGYIGLHTQIELDYARSLNKKIVFLEPEGGSK